MLAAALSITFAIMSLIYYVVPKGHVPWHGVWPGALFVTITTAIGNAVFPVYLTSISDLDRIGGALGFILIALIWFYLISLAILAGAVINALRHELHDTGSLDVPGWGARGRARGQRGEVPNSARRDSAHPGPRRAAARTTMRLIGVARPSRCSSEVETAANLQASSERASSDG